MEEADRDETCMLSMAGDVIEMLIHGLVDKDGIEKCVGVVKGAEFKVSSLILWNEDNRLEGD
jgi:hypothetical protein